MNLKKKILDQAQIALDSKNAFYLFLPKTNYIINHGVKFIFHYYDSFLTKLLFAASTKESFNPLLPPFDKHIHVCDLNQDSNHYLLINKYMQQKGHIVLSSMDKNAKQGSNLNILDFNAFETIFKSFNYEGMLYYNSGLNSGCSQLHKHLQYTPVEEFPVLDFMAKHKPLPIIYHALNIGKVTSKKMMEAYNKLLKIAKKDPPHNSYNFIISKGCAFYIPRKLSQYKCGTVFNSFAISGNFSIWSWSDPQIKKEPLSILKEICFPID